VREDIQNRTGKERSQTHPGGNISG